MTKKNSIPGENFWPEDYKCAVSFSFDVDADSFWRLKLDSSGRDREEPVVNSLGSYAINRGLPRVLTLLKKYSIKATFFVPGVVAEKYPASIKKIVEDGHEIGHHTYDHKDPSSMSEEAQIQDIDDGIDALVRTAGVKPIGYRSPGSLPLSTVDALLDRGIVYDSSLMGDDIPYYFQSGTGRNIVEIPWKFSVDDFVWYGFNFDPPLAYKAAPPADPRTVTQVWMDEFDVIFNEGLFFTLIGHPHQIGQASRIKALEEFMKYVKRDEVWIATYNEIAKRFSKE